MSFLTLSGIAWPVSTDAAAPKIVEVGWSGRAIDGTMTATRRAIKREWKLKTIPLSPTDSLAFQGSVLGLGHHWSFDQNAVAGNFLYSDKGLGYSTLSGSAVWTSGTSKFGAGCLELTSASILNYTALVGVDGNTAGGYGVIIWFYNGTSWDGYAVGYNWNTSTTVVYKNGAYLGSALPGFLTISGAGVSVEGKNFAGSYQASFFDDLVILPYQPRNADLAIWSNASVAFSPLPKLNVGGDVISGISPNAPAAVYGALNEIKEMIVNTGDGNGLYDNAQQISFTLTEP